MRSPRRVVALTVVCGGLATPGAGQSAGRAGATCCRRRPSSTSSTAAGRPTVVLSPARDVVAVLEHARMPTIAELVAADAAPRRPAHRSGAPTAAHRVRYRAIVTLKAVADGAARQVTLPTVARADLARLLARRRPLRVHADRRRPASSCGSARRPPAAPRRCPAPTLNAVLGDAVRVGGHGRARWSVPRRCPAAARRRRAPAVPTGPNVQEHRGGLVAGAHLSGPARPRRTTRRSSSTTPPASS